MSARCLPTPRSSGRPSPDASNGPRSRNSTAVWEPARHPTIHQSQARHKSRSRAAQGHGQMLVRSIHAWEVDMSIGKALRRFVLLGLLLLLTAGSSHGAEPGLAPPPGPEPSLARAQSQDRPSTVVVNVPDGGFHWSDAGVGAAATVAAALLAL